MIINITQHCTLKCPHCMQCAGPERTEFMSLDTYLKSLNFANKIGSEFLLISGGEPTSHPQFFEFLRLAIESGKMISVLSNGTFLRDHAFTERYATMVRGYKYFSMQISSFKGLYDNYKEMHKPNLKGLRMFGEKVVLCDERNTRIEMKPLGRACSGPWYEEAKKVNGFPSCINPCLILAQYTDIGSLGIGALFEMTRKFCSPMVSWDGSIRMGESDQCKVVANVSESIAEINRKLFEFRPCGGCDSFKWHLLHPATEQEKKVCSLLFKGKEQNNIKEE